MVFCMILSREDLRVPWTARRSNQSILKEISPEYSLEGLMLKLNLQYFGQLMWRTDSFEKTLMLGKIEGRRRRGWHWMKWMASPTQWIWVWVNSKSWWWTGRSGVLQSMGSQSQTRLIDWTELIWLHHRSELCSSVFMIFSYFAWRPWYCISHFHFVHSWGGPSPPHTLFSG